MSNKIHMLFVKLYKVSDPIKFDYLNNFKIENKRTYQNQVTVDLILNYVMTVLMFNNVVIRSLLVSTERIECQLGTY